MKIVPIFARENKCEGLFSIHFDNEEEDEATKCINRWLFDNEYLYNFFISNQKDLNNGYYDGTISIQEAINYTREEALHLFEKLRDLAITESYDNESLSAVFQPLNNNDYRQTPLQKVKAKTKTQKRWLRLYAIKIGPNTFIITGGAIKLVEFMDDEENLIKEKQKLEEVKNFLKDEGILDQEDFDVIYEL